MSDVELNRLEGMRLKAVEEVHKYGGKSPSFTMDFQYTSVAAYVKELQRSGMVLIRQAREANALRKAVRKQ